ncbi:MAG: hypothetical protein JJT78_14175 [Leptospira sp.]|nr:hypothetical protein [Leptospira sp.]
MKNSFRFFCFSLMLFMMQCTTVDFIPDSDYTPNNPNYSKNNWQEVEIYFTRPPKRFTIQGEVKVRDFENSGRISDYLNYIKKDMYAKKMDGVWMKSAKVENVQDQIFQTMDSRGNVTHSYESETQVKIWRGYAYRDKR